MSYHLAEIPKGELGKWSKVEEELAEFYDAKQQGSKILMLVELSDLYGALSHYMKHNVIAFNWRKKVDDVMELIDTELLEIGIEAEEIVRFSEITERAFKSGARK